ncbi:MAG: hypothetical protein CMF69_00795 [Magnetovibrio sp.]|nr:hypothetical protein [Magnetovibrio sp.]
MGPSCTSEDFYPGLLEQVALTYEQRFKRYGDTPRGVFWKNADWQRHRYNILVRIFDREEFDDGLKIHDFGCGYGAFFDYLTAHSAMHASYYTGTEMCKEILAAAQKRVDDPRANFISGIFPTVHADYTFVSGTFNMRLDAEDTVWSEYIRVSLLQLWQHTRRGFAFNLLNDSTHEKHKGLYYASPKFFIEFVRTNMDPSAELIIEPPLPDFTILARRSQPL